MNKSKFMIIFIFLSLLLNGILVFSFDNTVKAGTTIVVAKDASGDYDNLGDAVNNSNDGDTIYIKSGTYYHFDIWNPIVVTKNITIYGENANTTILKTNFSHAYPGRNILQINCTTFTMYELNISKPSGTDKTDGAMLLGEELVTIDIYDCVFYAYLGIRANNLYNAGLIIHHCDFIGPSASASNAIYYYHVYSTTGGNVTIHNCTFLNNSMGIDAMDNFAETFMEYVIVENCTFDLRASALGARIYFSNNVLIQNNVFIDEYNTPGGLCGVFASENIVIYNNNINGACLCGPISNCQNVTISDNYVSNYSDIGKCIRIGVVSSPFISNWFNITNNTIINCSNIISIETYLKNTTIEGNIFDSPDFCLKVLYNLLDNVTIYNNYFNGTDVYVNDDAVVFNISKTGGTNIINGIYLGGNYWWNYTGTDSNGDGIGDTPYDINGSSLVDYLPLVYIVPMFDNISADPNPGYETNTFYFNVSIEDPDTAVLSQIRCVLTFEGNAYSNNSMAWIEGNNLTGANYSYNVTLTTIGIFGYKFQAYDGINWNETTTKYLLVQGLPGHFDAELFLCFYDATSGTGIDEKLFKIYLSTDTTINESDRIYNTHQYTYTGAVYYYKITDYFDNKIYPLSEDYETVTINRLYKYLDIPITWYDLAIKNMNETIMYFSMNNGSRYYNITLFPQDTCHLYVIPGNYNITKHYYYINNGTYFKNETDTFTVYNSTFYIASGYTAFVHISWYNTNEGLGLPDETLKIYIDGVRQIGMTHWTFINKTINLTIKDYYNLTMYENNFTLNNTYTFLDLGLTFHSWLFGNMNQKYYMISFLKDGGSRWYERGIVPYGQREFMLPSGNYTMRIYDANWSEIHNESYVMNRSMVYVINGTNLTTIIEGQSVITGQLLELDELIDYALMPDNIIWSMNPPIMFSVFDRTGQMLGNNVWKICPALDVISTTRNSTYTNHTISHPLVPTNGTTENGTITVMKDAIYLSGSSSITWVNITYTDNGTLMQNTTYIPNKINLGGENLTINASDNISILRETTFSKMTKFYWNVYNSTTNPGHIAGRAGYHSTVLNVENNMNNPIYDVYVFGGFSDLTTPDLNTIRIEDLENGILLERGENYKTTGDGIEFMISGGMNASSNRSFKTSYYKDTAHTYVYEDAQIEIRAYQEEKTLNGYDDFFNYMEFTWINDHKDAFRGSLRVKLGFKMDLDKDSVKVYDLDENMLIDDEHIIVGLEFIWISGNALGSIPSGGGRTLGIYFKEILYPGTNLMEIHLATPIGNFLGITFTPFLIIFILASIPIMAGSLLMIRKMKYKQSYGTMITIGALIIFIFFILQAQGV